MSENVKISNIEISNSKKLTVIAGLNVLENDELAFEVANKLKNVTESKGNLSLIHI